jgi:L-ascorbate metabolism protein UlaG (beta-lactamase superfamily)
MRLSVALLLAACTQSPHTPPPGDAVGPTAAPTLPAEGAAASAPSAPALPAPALTIDGETGPIAITAVYHATTLLQAGGKTWWLDPWSRGPIEGLPKADVVLITDVHPDHLDPAALDVVSTASTIFIGPAAAADGLGDRSLTHTLGNGETIEVAGARVTAVPMYNLSRGPEGGGVYHERGRGNGYVLAIDGRRLYFAGDTECTDEMRALTDIDVAFVPMNLPYTMTPGEAAACVRAFRPKRVVAYHHAGSDLDTFERALRKIDGVQLVAADYYPGGAPW